MSADTATTSGGGACPSARTGATTRHPSASSRRATAPPSPPVTPVTNAEPDIGTVCTRGGPGDPVGTSVPCAVRCYWSQRHHASALASRGDHVQEFTVPPVVTVSETTNLTDPVWVNAVETPQAPQFALKTATGWTDVTCAEFRDRVLAIARGLVAAGVAPGDRVGLLSR